ITLFNMGTGGAFSTGYAHPFHVHGTHFHVMKVGWPQYNTSGMISTLNPDIDCAGPDTAPIAPSKSQTLLITIRLHRLLYACGVMLQRKNV
ncbi:hypothetical protein ANCDUO_23477, partial [Ancylostoma duodenale]